MGKMRGKKSSVLCRIVVLVIAFALLAGNLPDMVFAQEITLEEQVEANEVRLEELRARCRELLPQVKELQDAGKLPTIKDLLGLSISGYDTYGVIKAFVEGGSFLLGTINISGFEPLYKALYENYSYDVVVGSYKYMFVITIEVKAPVAFTEGAMSSAKIGAENLPAQGDASILASQEVTLYIGEAVESMMQLICAAYNGGGERDMLTLLSSLRTLLGFSVDELNSLNNTAIAAVNNNSITTTLSAKGGNGITYSKKVTISQSDIVKKVLNDYTKGYAWIETIRDIILNQVGISEDMLPDLVELLALIEDLVDGSMLGKYSSIQAESNNQAADTLLTYLIDDLTRVQHSLETADQLSGVIAKLTGGSGDIMELLMGLLGEENATLGQTFGELVDRLLVQYIPGAEKLGIGAVIGDMFGLDNLHTTRDVITKIDQLILSLTQLKEGLGDIDLDKMLVFAEQLLAGTLQEKYMNLSLTKAQDVGVLLHHFQDDLDGSIALLKAKDLVNQSFRHVIKDNQSITDYVVDYLGTVLAGMIDERLAEVYPDAGGYGIGEFMAGILKPIKQMKVQPLIEYLSYNKVALDAIVDAYDEVGSYLEFNEDGRIDNLNIDRILESMGTSRQELEDKINSLVEEAKQATENWLSTIEKAKDATTQKVQKELEKIQAELESTKQKVNNWLNKWF